MEKFLPLLATNLILSGVLGLIVLIAPAMLLVLVFKRRGLPTVLIGLGLLLSLGLALLGITIEGLLNGEVLAWSRSIFTVSVTSAPLFYWFSAVAFLTTSLALVVGSLWLAARNIMKRSPSP